MTISSSRLILAFFLVAQACDGVFTYVVVRADGLAAEGNLLLATWMDLLGPAPALLGAKILAVACGIVLYAAGVHRVLAWLTGLYVVVALGPWVIRLQQY